ncbi:GGDEF domain-containing protein [Kineosporia sp. J2-2]|uniref:GGDEF domain-containing protein n=1 Tax=Kineosporia corallincola TaxID=2835133 RepID=A0ABS5THW5_9ACTN|nr:GGDEF domain-containing protein [Kineosporia corallincola]MBT0769648.1 GGDEF domain-containing protein [Kineosporia corallincola]
MSLTARIPAAARRVVVVVAAELAVTLLAWTVLNALGLHQTALPVILGVWSAVFLLSSLPVQEWLTRRSGSGGESANLLIVGVAVWVAMMTTTELPSLYPVVIGALAAETAQRDWSTRTAAVGMLLLFGGTGLAQLGVHEHWIYSKIPAWPSDHIAVVLLAVGGVVLVRGVVLARMSASTRAALAQEQRLRHEELRHAATHDPLTGLLSRRGLDPVLSAAVGAARPGHGVAVMFLDLDGFKAVNDSHGHGVGDELLVAAAVRFADALGPGGALARMGGDEFVAVLDGVPSAAVAAHRLSQVQAALERPFALRSDSGQELQLRVGASGGLAWAGRQADPEALMREADRAMYRNKHLRKGERRRAGVDVDGVPGVTGSRLRVG